MRRGAEEKSHGSLLALAVNPTSAGDDAQAQRSPASEMLFQEANYSIAHPGCSYFIVHAGAATNSSWDKQRAICTSTLIPCHLLCRYEPSQRSEPDVRLNQA